MSHFPYLMELIFYGRMNYNIFLVEFKIVSKKFVYLRMKGDVLMLDKFNLI